MQAIAEIEDEWTAEMLKMFAFEELAKGYFPHKFNIPQLHIQNYVGPIDISLQQYTSLSLKRKKKVSEMHKYCHSDVDILRREFQKFREMFITLQDVNGKYSLGQDPLHYTTIAALTNDGLFRRSYLKHQTIKYVESPPRSNYSADSVLWMSYDMGEL